jgi:hypothetical protein
MISVMYLPNKQDRVVFIYQADEDRMKYFF